MHVLFFGFMMLISNVAMADALLFVSPLRVEMKPGEETSVITVTNKTDTTRRYRVELTDQVMNAEGVLETQETFPYSAKRMLRFMPRRVVLEAGQRQVVRIMARKPGDLPAGDYHTHLLFEEEKASASLGKEVSATAPAKGLVLDLGTTYGVAIPVVLQHGELSSSLVMTDVQVKRRADGQPSDILAAFQRNGNAEASGMLTVTTGDVNLVSPRRVRVYREVNDVVISLPLIEAGIKHKGLATVKLTDGAEVGPKVLFEKTIDLP